MSKSTLKKLLAQMTAEQMAEMILELYDARAEAKDYLDFYTNPDIESRLEKARVAIAREASRQSRGRNRARVTRLRKLIKDITSLNPGGEAVAEVMVCAVKEMCLAANSQIIDPTHQRGFARLLKDCVKGIETSGFGSRYLPMAEKAVDEIAKGGKGAKRSAREMRDKLGEAWSEALEECVEQSVTQRGRK